MRGPLPTAAMTPAALVAPPPRAISGAPRQRPKPWANAPPPTRPQLAGCLATAEQPAGLGVGRCVTRLGGCRRGPASTRQLRSHRPGPGGTQRRRLGGGGCDVTRPRVGHHRPRPSCSRCWPAPTPHPFRTGVSPGPRPAARPGRGGPYGAHRGGGRVPPLLPPPARGRLSSPDRQPPPGPQTGLLARRRRRMESRQCTLAAVHRCGSTIYYQRR